MGPDTLVTYINQTLYYVLYFETIFFPSFLKDKENKPEYVGNELIQRSAAYKKY